MNQSLTIKNAMDYLESMDFENIQFTGEENGCLYFNAYHVDDEETKEEIEFDPNEYENRVIVSVKVNNEWKIYEILED
jgi:hypothetical protein